MNTESLMAQPGIIASLWACADPTFDGGKFEPPNTAPLSLASYIGRMRKALTVQEVAGLLTMSSRTVQQWAKAGRLPAIRHGSLTRFDPIQLARWVRDNSTGPAIKTT
jgi:excisionase family DNA binding protein